MNCENVLLIGGTGFLGRHLAHQLAARGARIIVATRRAERARDLLPLPTVEVVECDVHDPATLARLVAGCDTVVNLAGVLSSRNGRPYGADFASVHVELPRAIAAACRNAAVQRLLHVSALHAGAEAPSQYLRSKAAGEVAIREAAGEVAITIFRPSVIFGPGDRFLSLFVKIAGVLPVLPLACPKARFQPVYVLDAAASIVSSLDHSEAAGASYDLCGPSVYTLGQLVEYACRTAGRPRLIVGLPGALARAQAMLLEMLPGKIMTRDNLDSMKLDSVCEGSPLPFGREPTRLEVVAPVYLAGETARAHFLPMRMKSRR